MRIAWALSAAVLVAAGLIAGLTWTGGPTVRAVSAGGGHTCAIVGGGTLYCWGANDSGQVGDGTTVAQRSPVRVSGLEAKVTQVAAAAEHTCALVDGGHVWCWGQGGDGQLGNGAAETSATPVAVTGLDGVTAISAGYWHTCAVTEQGQVRCWGLNAFSQLGNASSISSPEPIVVLDERDAPLAGVAAVAAGLGHTCALLDAGGVKCWGWNYQGQLAQDSLALCGDQLTDPCSLVAADATYDDGTPLAGVAAIAAGMGHTCALLESGALECWGQNDAGQLGNGTTEAQYAPRRVSGLGSGVASVSTWGVTTCATTADGAAMCWGSNRSGQLGNGTASELFAYAEPGPVAGLDGGAVAISPGGEHTCAIQGALRCWGSNFAGELGGGASGEPRLTPVAVRFVDRNDVLTGILIALPMVLTTIVIASVLIRRREAA